MDLTALLIFAPAIMGLAWIGYLLFTKNLADRGLLNIITYFLGVIIMFIAVGWLIDYFFFSWINERLEEAQGSTEAQELRIRSEQIMNEAFGEDETPLTIVGTPQPTPVIIVITPTPNPFDSAVPVDPGRGPVQYVVQSGDTLAEIGKRFGVPYQDIMAANGLYTWTIYPGDVLLIPAPTLVPAP